MNNLLYALCFVSLSLVSCEYVQNLSDVGDQVSFLMDMRTKYGGEWKGSIKNSCYQIEITNSETFDIKSDSLTYNGILLGREFTAEFGVAYPCLQLVMKDETKVGIMSKSSSESMTLNLDLLHRFRNRDVDYYLTAKQSLYAAVLAEEGKLPEAQTLVDELGSEVKHPFVDLALAHIDRAVGDNESASENIKQLLRENPNDDILIQYIGLYFLKYGGYEMSLPLFKKAASLNKENDEHIMNIGSVFYQMEEYDSSSYYYSKVIERDSSNIKAWYNRAEIRFKQQRDDEACQDIQQILEIEPRTQLPESTLRKCGIEN